MPGEKDLHPYQKFCVDFLEEKPQCALFLDCGLGKTIITLTAISHLLYEPPSSRQAELWSKRWCAFHQGFLLSFSFAGFPLGAGRKGSVVGGTQRAFSSRRTGAGSPGRAFALAAQKPGAGRSRWAGPPRGGRGSGRRAFPPPATPVSLGSGKIASHKTANKKRLSVAQTSPFRKNRLFRAI